MFTSEIEGDKITITVLDVKNSAPDLIVEMTDDGVTFRQYVESETDYLGNGVELYDEINVTNEQFENLLKALDLPFGTYMTTKGSQCE